MRKPAFRKGEKSSRQFDVFRRMRTITNQDSRVGCSSRLKDTNHSWDKFGSNPVAQISPSVGILVNSLEHLPSIRQARLRRDLVHHEPSSRTRLIQCSYNTSAS